MRGTRCFATPAARASRRMKRYLKRYRVACVDGAGVCVVPRLRPQPIAKAEWLALYHIWTAEPPRDSPPVTP